MWQTGCSSWVPTQARLLLWMQGSGVRAAAVSIETVLTAARRLGQDSKAPFGSPCTEVSKGKNSVSKVGRTELDSSQVRSQQAVHPRTLLQRGAGPGPVEKASP